MAHRPTSRAAGKVKRTRSVSKPTDEATRKAKAGSGKAATAKKAAAKAKSPTKPASAAKKAAATKPVTAAKNPAATKKLNAIKPAATKRPPKVVRTAKAKPPVKVVKVSSPRAAKPAAKTRRTAPKPGRELRASERPYLAAELGQPVDHEGEPIGAGSPMAQSDTELQKYTLELWRQMQSRRVASRHTLAMERAGVTIDDLWTAGVTDKLTTTSTTDEVRRYRQNLLFRANLLESILTETVAELRRLETVEPTSAEPVREAG